MGAIGIIPVRETDRAQECERESAPKSASEYLLYARTSTRSHSAASLARSSARQSDNVRALRKNAKLYKLSTKDVLNLCAHTHTHTLNVCAHTHTYTRAKECDIAHE